MNEADDSDEIIDLLTALIDGLSQGWEPWELNSMRRHVKHGEYGEPLENIIGGGLQSGDGFDASQMSKIETLITLMELEGSEWVLKLREWQRNHAPSPTTSP